MANGFSPGSLALLSQVPTGAGGAKHPPALEHDLPTQHHPGPPPPDLPALIWGTITPGVEIGGVDHPGLVGIDLDAGVGLFGEPEDPAWVHNEPVEHLAEGEASVIDRAEQQRQHRLDAGKAGGRSRRGLLLSGVWGVV